MQLIQKYLTKNRCYTNFVKIKPTKLVLHSLGVAQPKADNIINNWNNQAASVSVHALIETDRVIQTLPWDYRAWHIGSGVNGSYNSCAIGIEICEPAGHTYASGGVMLGYDIKKNEEYFDKVYNNAVELFSYLCTLYNLSPEKDILCHSEVYKIGYGSNHADVMHWFPKHDKSMETFREDVKKQMVYKPTKTINRESTIQDIKWLQEKLNSKLLGHSNIPLNVDGAYGNKTRIAVLIYWEVLGWNKEGKDDGWKIGKKTIDKLT